MCVCVCVHVLSVYMCTISAQCLWKQEEGVVSPVAWVTDGYESTDVRAASLTSVLGKNNKCSLLKSLTSGSQIHF